MLALECCPICGSIELQKIPANLAPFIRIRCGIETEPISLSRCYCTLCDFSFFDHRFDGKETLNLYRGYRGEAYRALRERLEPGSAATVDLHEGRDSQFHRVRIHHAATLLSQWGVQPRRVLDYGGEADGWLARGLFPDAEVLSYDLSTDMAPPQGSFDLILCAHVLEHVSFPTSFLKDLGQFLTPDGLLYVEVPYDPVGPLAKTLLQGHPLNRMHEHISLFTPLSVCRLLAVTGMEPTHVGSFRAGSYYRGIAALARRSDTQQALPLTTEGLPLDPAEDLYAPLQNGQFQRMDHLARGWLKQGIRVVLYPAGNFAMEILAGSQAMSEAVVALGDGNPDLCGKALLNKKVYSAAEIPNLGAQILLIASPLHENEIAEQLASLENPELRLVRASQLFAGKSFLMSQDTPSALIAKLEGSASRHITLPSSGPRNERAIGNIKFIIFSHPRSGSNFLRDILNQHPRMLELGELLHSDLAIRRLIPGLEFSALRENLYCLDDVYQFLMHSAETKRVSAIGFTLFSHFSGHFLSDSQAVHLALREDQHPIFLIRRNLLKSFISAKRAHFTGAWHLDAQGSLIQWAHSRTFPDALKQTIGPIDVDEAKEWISKTKEFLFTTEQALSAQKKEYCTVFYEDLCLGGPSKTLSEVNRIMQFLKLNELTDFMPTQSRMASRSFYESIPNRQELIDATGYDLD